jgi:hypothetical protein
VLARGAERAQVGGVLLLGEELAPLLIQPRPVLVQRARLADQQQQLVTQRTVLRLDLLCVLVQALYGFLQGNGDGEVREWVYDG